MSDAPETLELFLTKYGQRSATLTDVYDVFDTLMEKWSEMNQKNVERNARLDTLEKEVAALKARPLQKWAGIHVEGVQYAQVSLVTRQGSLWSATCTTTTRPATRAQIGG